jgi:hypothetical protein
VCRFAGIAVVEPDDLKPIVDEGCAEVVVPVEHVGRDGHDQQQRIAAGTETLLGDVDAAVVRGEGFHQLVLDGFVGVG